MPYEDLPCRRERSAPTFDASDPCEIERYFDDLEFLFLKHDCVHSLICSESELGGFYREFLLVSRFLIAKGRISTPEQSRAFSASLGPRLAIAVHNRLDRIFPDHLPEDLYDSDVIYEATRCTLAWEHSVPLVEPPRPFP